MRIKLNLYTFIKNYIILYSIYSLFYCDKKTTSTLVKFNLYIHLNVISHLDLFESFANKMGSRLILEQYNCGGILDKSWDLLASYVFQWILSC